MKNQCLLGVIMVCLSWQMDANANANTNADSISSLNISSHSTQHDAPSGHQHQEAAPADAKNPSENVKQELDDIVTSDTYSQTTTISSWQKNKSNENQEQNRFSQWLSEWLERIFGDVDMTGVSQGLGVIGKGVALLFLLGLGWWLYKTRQTWMAWFAALSSPTRAKDAITPTPIWQAEEGVWENLPQSAKLEAFLKSLLGQGLWLPALSALYRGTLKEVSMRHHLPIDHHQTEDECVWLLRQSSAGSSEREFFERLVHLWRASAYGQKIPPSVTRGDYGDILELIEMWAKLYGSRAMR